MWVLLALACTGTSPTDTGELCADRRAVTWNNWGHGFVQTWCQPCHSAGSADRYGAPEAVNLDTLDQVVSFSDSISRTVLDDETMPVGGGVSDEDKALLRDFLECGLP